MGDVMQCGLATFARGCDVGLGIEQHPGHLNAPLLRSQVQRRVAGLVLAVHIDPGGQVRLNRINEPKLGRKENRAGSPDLRAGLAALLPQQRGDLLLLVGEIKRRLALALCVHVGPLLDQQRCRLLLPAPYRHVQRGVAVLVGGVHVRTALEMFPDGIEIAHLCGGENIPGRGQFLCGFAALGAEQLNDLGSFLGDGVVERRLVLFVPSVDGGAVLQQ